MNAKIVRFRNKRLNFPEFNLFLLRCIKYVPLRWRHDGRDGVSNHQPHDCLLNRLFGRRSKKTTKLCVTGLCAGNSPRTGEFPAQMASNAENVPIWRRLHDEKTLKMLRVHVYYQLLMDPYNGLTKIFRACFISILAISIQCFREWPGVTRQQAIT